MKRSRAFAAMAVAGTFAMMACGPDPMASDALDIETGVQKRNGGASVASTYEVTVYNFTGGQPFTPPLAATHQGPVDLFDIGAPASFGLKEIAENGNLAPLQTQLESSDHVSNVVVAVAGSPPPILPGQSVTFTIDAAPGARFLSFVSMLICTNDGFTGSDAVRLPNRVGSSLTIDLNAYDAGTEINTEDFSNLVPPCPALTGVVGAPPGSGSSDPALAENGVITHHSGVMGSAGLQLGLHDWTDPVGRISITRTN